MIGLYLVTALVVAIGVLVFLWYNKFQKTSAVEAVTSWPIIGSALHLEREPHALFKQVRELAIKSNYLCVFWLFYTPVYFVGRVEYAEFVLRSQEIITKSYLYSFLHSWLGTGLLTSTREKWKSRRRAITPSFHFTILNDFQEVFLKQAQILASKLKPYADSGKAFDVQVPVSLATLDIICETAMNVSINAQSEADSEYVQAINIANSEFQRRQRSPWIWSDFIYYLTPRGRLFSKNLKMLHDFTTKVINEKVQLRKTHPEVSLKKSKAFMDMLLEMYEKGEIDVEGIREEVDTFMFEGHDTTAAGLSWTLYMLGLHPEVQEKLHAEIDEFTSKDGDLVEKIKSMKYLEYVIKEGLRLHPPVAIFGREVEEDTTILSTTFLKGSTLMVDVISLHTNPEYWDEPLVFNPDRFADEKFLKRNPYCYVPFSAGPRNCIGQKFAMLEEKILLYHVMLNFKIQAAQNEEDVKACFEIIHKSENGLKIILKPR